MNITKVTPLKFTGFYRPYNDTTTDIQQAEKELEFSSFVQQVGGKMVPDNKDGNKIPFQHRVYYLV